jgi:hypothetical protein
MKIGERMTPVVAALSAVATLACCLPLGGATLFGVGTVFAVVGSYERWLLPLSGALLALGGALIWRSRRVCHTTSRLSVAILAFSAVIVSLVWLFPQAVAGFLANWSS